MRAAPPVRVSVIRFGLWRAALFAVLAAGWLVIGAWVASHGLARHGPAATAVLAVGGSLLLLSGWLVAGLARVDAFDLRWDERCWFLSPAGMPSIDGLAGEVRVAIDLGGWLLLRFLPDPPAGGAGPRWLPVQRRGPALDWHGLRCALYSPQPRAAEVAVAVARPE